MRLSPEIDRLVMEEKQRIDAHMPDCFALPRSCQSCGCDRQGRLYGNGSRACSSHEYIVAWAQFPASKAVRR